jgi:signal peptidase II
MWLVALVAVLVFAVDQASKVWIVWHLNLAGNLTMDVLPPWLNLRMAWNQGMTFGLFANDAEVTRWLLIAIALGVSLWVWLWIRREPHSLRTQLSAGLLIGGALGNVVDRVLYGAVADFLNMSCCGIENPFAFNVADVAIFAGAIGLVLFSGRARPGAGHTGNSP